jgi:hypothetical protein
VTWDPLIIDDDVAPATWVPFKVQAGEVGSVLEILVDGNVDAWTSGSLLNHLADAWSPCHQDIVLDLSRASCPDRTSAVALARCGEFAADRGVRLRIVQPGRLAA